MSVEDRKCGENGLAQRPTLDGFIAWLRTKDADAEYNYYDCNGDCLVGQYLNFIGMKWDEGGGDWYIANSRKTSPIVAVSCSKDWTFGAALSRAIAFRDAQSAGR